MKRIFIFCQVVNFKSNKNCSKFYFPTIYGFCFRKQESVNGNGNIWSISIAMLKIVREPLMPDLAGFLKTDIYLIVNPFLGKFLSTILQILISILYRKTLNN